MDKNKLLDVLEIFKHSREKLSYDFISENVEIFKPMFQYENEQELMYLAVEKYFIGYINYHFLLSEKYDSIEIEFGEAMLKFLKEINVSFSNSELTASKGLFLQLLSSKIVFLNDLIGISFESNKKLNKLSYSYQKDKTLFDRKIKQLKEN
jgi:hypothetical protein